MQSTPRSYITIPQSKDSPAAIVRTALRADVPEDAGRRPPDDAEKPPGLADRVVSTAEDGATEEPAIEEAGTDGAAAEESAAEDVLTEEPAAEDTEP